MLDNQLDDGHMTIVGSRVNWCPALCCVHVGVRAISKQALRMGKSAAACGYQQRFGLIDHG